MAPKCIILKLSPSGEVLTKRDAQEQTFIISKKSTTQSIDQTIKSAYKVSENGTLQLRVDGHAVPIADLVTKCITFMETSEAPWFDINEEDNDKFVVVAQVRMFEEQFVTYQRFHIWWWKRRSPSFVIATRLLQATLNLLKQTTV